MSSQVKTRHEKKCPAKFKALDQSQGTFEAIVSVFGNVDLIGDRVVKGAFTKSLQDWNASGDPIPVIWNHEWDNPDAHIGKTLEAEEREEGLWVKGQLDMEEPFAAKVFKLMQQRRVKEFSFAYDIVDEAKAKDGANDLRELTLIEVGPTLKGMNPETELMATKTRDQKAGRVLSAKNESDLKNAMDLIQGVLAQLASNDEDEKAKAEEPEQVKTQPQVEVEEPAEVKTEEPDLVAELFRSALAVGGAI